MFTHILTATDGSDWAFKGVKVAIEMARTLGARLTVVTASDLTPGPYYAEGILATTEYENFSENMRIRAEEVLQDVAKACKAEGVTPNLVYAPATHPATAILEKSVELGCDLIIIGSRGRRGLTKLILGSQAAEVLAGTTVPLMIIK